MDGRVPAPTPFSFFLSFFPSVTPLTFLVGTKVLPEKQRRLRSLTLCLSERIVHRFPPTCPEAASPISHQLLALLLV